MSEQLKPYLCSNFTCDYCQRKFWKATTYAPDASLKETYCTYCVETYGEVFCSFPNKGKKCLNPIFIKKKQLCRPHYYQTWKRLNKLKKKTLRKLSQDDKRFTGRTQQLNLKVREQTYLRLKELASKNKCLMTEVLERMLESYKNKE